MATDKSGNQANPEESSEPTELSGTHSAKIRVPKTFDLPQNEPKRQSKIPSRGTRKISERQIRANRLNALRSTGPRTPEGKRGWRPMR